MRQMCFAFICLPFALIYTLILHYLYFENNFITTSFAVNNNCNVVASHSVKTVSDDRVYYNYVMNVSFIANDGQTYYGDACSSRFATSEITQKWNYNDYPYARIADLNGLMVWYCALCDNDRCDNNKGDKEFGKCLVSEKPTHHGRYDVVFEMLPYFPHNDYNATIACTLIASFVFLIWYYAVDIYMTDTEHQEYLNKQSDGVSCIANMTMYAKLFLSNIHIIALLLFLVTKGNFFKPFDSRANELLCASFYFFMVTVIAVYVVAICYTIRYDDNCKIIGPITAQYMRCVLLPVFGIWFYFISDSKTKKVANSFANSHYGLLVLSSYFPQLVILLMFGSSDSHKAFYDDPNKDKAYVATIISSLLMIIILFFENVLSHSNLQCYKINVRIYPVNKNPPLESTHPKQTDILQSYDNETSDYKELNTSKNNPESVKMSTLDNTI
jgi:hypothetical protein